VVFEAVVGNRDDARVRRGNCSMTRCVVFFGGLKDARCVAVGRQWVVRFLNGLLSLQQSPTLSHGCKRVEGSVRIVIKKKSP
jgi:hypothetical protein